MANIELLPLEQSDREQFIKDNQEAFNYGALEEFGLRDDHFEEDGEIISRETIESSIDCGEAYRIMQDGKPVGGVVIKTDGERGNLDLLFVSPHVHSKGIGYAAWCEVEKLHPEVTVWETVTPYFEKRNIHFYVNRCGFHIVEFYNSHHPDPSDPDAAEQLDDQFPDGMFRFEKRLLETDEDLNKALWEVFGIKRMKLSVIFEEKPERWGFRGDPYFWDHLKGLAEEMDIISPDELETWIKEEYFSLSGKPLTDEYMDFAVIKQFAHGGMSSGGVDNRWWMEEGIPLLKSRLTAIRV